MAKGKRKGRPPGQTVTFGSDDERAYAKEATPNPDGDDFYHDEIDQFHAEKEKILLDKGASYEPAAYSSDEESVLGVGGSDDSDDEEIAEYERRLHRFKSQGFKDELASDVEEDAEHGLPDTKAWGKSAAKFYGADVSDSDEDLGDGSGSETDAAILEEQEALAIQKKMAAQLDDADIGLDMFKPSAKKPTETKEEEKITKDLSKLSKKEKSTDWKKESPELLELIEDFKAKLKELEDHLLPVHQLIKDNKLPSSKGADYVVTKTQLYLNYCVNLSFYLTLKAKHTPIHNHPVVGRIVQYRNLIQQLKTVEEKVQTEMEFILERVKDGKDVPLADSSENRKLDLGSFVQRKRPLKLKKKTSESRSRLSELVSDSDGEEDGTAMSGQQLLAKGGKTWGRKPGSSGDPARYETPEEKQALEFYRMLKAGQGLQDSQGDQKPQNTETDMQGVEEGEGAMEGVAGDEEEGDGRRAIDYTIAKNKGLTRKRKKEYRNPRVRNRMKHKEAIKRRKGQIRVVRKELAPYAGELSGIRAGVKKSVKFKS